MSANTARQPDSGREERDGGKMDAESKGSAVGANVESLITAHDLEAVMGAFSVEGESGDSGLCLDRSQFSTLLHSVLNKGTPEEFGELYDKINVTKEDSIDWDKFAAYMLSEFYEKDDKVRSTQVPNWMDLKVLSTSVHKDVIQRAVFLKNSNRYVVISKEGSISMWNTELKLQRSFRTQTDTCRSKDLWVTHFTPMPSINKMALAFTSKEIAIYDMSSKLDFSTQYKITELPHTPLCLDFWSHPVNANEAVLAWGDVDGGVTCIMFSTVNIALFDRPSAPAGSGKQETCLVVRWAEVTKGLFKNARAAKHDLHSEWVRQVRVIPSLECVMSCTTTNTHSVVIGWLDKHSSSMRTSVFNVTQGINAFDYHPPLNLIATAGVNQHVCLWNPYVVSKPNGLLRGHMTSVVQVQFIVGRGQLLSLSKDKVLRVWDVGLQVCIQRLANMFPKGPEVQTVLYFDEFRSRLFITFGCLLTVMQMRLDVRDRTYTHDKPVVGVVYNSLYNQVVTVCQGGVMVVWMIDTGQKVRSFTELHGAAEVTGLSQDPDETRLYTSSTDGTVKIWDFNGHCYHTLSCAGPGVAVDVGQALVLKKSVVVVGWSPYVTMFRNSSLRDFHVQPGEWKGNREHPDDVLSAAFDLPATLATASYDGTIVLWNIGTEQMQRKITARSIDAKGQRSKSRVVVVGAPQAGGAGSPTKQVAAVSGKQQQQQQLPKTASRPTKSPISRAYSRINAATAEDQADLGYAVTQMIFIESRRGNPAAGNLLSCGANGWVRFWNSQTCKLIGEFLAHPQVGSIIMATSSDATHLVTADVEGGLKVWDIAHHCELENADGSVNTQSPALRAQWQPHIDTINSLVVCERHDRLLVLSASSDGSVVLSDALQGGSVVGTFGQNEHWDLEEVVNNEAATTATAAAQDSDEKPSQADGDVEGKQTSHTDIVAIDDGWTPDERATTAPADYAVDSWSSTLLGRAYREERQSKRPRPQLASIPDLPYLHWERIGAPPLGPHAALETRSLDTVVLPKKPEFVGNPHKFFGEKLEELAPSARVPALIDSLQTSFDERSLFPKHLLDYENEMRRLSHVLQPAQGPGGGAQKRDSQARVSIAQQQPFQQQQQQLRVQITSRPSLAAVVSATVGAGAVTAQPMSKARGQNGRPDSRTTTSASINA